MYIGLSGFLSIWTKLVLYRHIWVKNSWCNISQQSSSESQVVPYRQMNKDGEASSYHLFTLVQYLLTVWMEIMFCLQKF